MMLEEFDGLIWLDASLRIGPDFDIVLAEALERDGIYLPSTSFVPNFVVTEPKMYDYLQPCSQEIDQTVLQKESGTIVMYKTERVYWNVIYWWLLCALDEKCMAPEGHQLYCTDLDRCYQNGTALCSRCHRYDQSAINILYNNHLQAINKQHLIASNPHEPFRVFRSITKMFQVKTCGSFLRYLYDVIFRINAHLR